MYYYRLLGPIIRSLPAETAHNMAINACALGLIPDEPAFESKALPQMILGQTFPNPVGLAAGFDKNAEAFHTLYGKNFGFAEVGTITPKPQPGNTKPRLFRLVEDEAVINRMGFNNQGLERCIKRIEKHKKLGVLGINIGKNKTSEDAVEDYLIGLEAAYSHASYITVNISSPNTEGLRELQQENALTILLSALAEKRTLLQQEQQRRTPILVKVAPDLTEEDIETMVGITMDQGMDGLIVGNTTIFRPDRLQSLHKDQTGGLSGKPLISLADHTLATTYKYTQGKLPLIGVGGIASAGDAYRKIRLGASLIQLYSALVYQGFGLVTEILTGLDTQLKQDGFNHISEAIGMSAING
jgi:dihydroorotate dehydrogenase